MSTEDAGAAGPVRPAPDAGAAPAGNDAEAGGEVRPRGRRFSGKRAALADGSGPAGSGVSPGGAVSANAGSSGEPAGRPRPGSSASSPQGAGLTADVPARAALDAISLKGDDGPSATPQKAEAIVGSAAADVSGEPGPGNPDAEPSDEVREPESAGTGLGTPAPVTEVATDPGPAWPLARRRGREVGADDAPPTGVITGSILPDGGGAGVAGPVRGGVARPVPGSVAGPVPGGIGRPATGGAGRPVAAGAEAVADAVAAPPLFLLDASRAVLTWARLRYLGSTSATGISVALAACAAVWFSAGTTGDTARGVAALWSSYLVVVAGRLVARQGGRADADHRIAGPVRWLAAIGRSVAEVAIYAGLTTGAAAQRYPGVWALGLGVVGLVAVRNLMTACSTPYGFGHPPESLLGRSCAAVATMTPGGRFLVVGVVAPFWGARTALLVLLAWGISTVCYGLAGRAVPRIRADVGEDGSAAASASLLRLRDDGTLARYLGALVRGSLLPLPPAVLGLAAVTALAVLGLHGLPGPLLIAPAIVVLLAAPGSANPHLGRLDWLVPELLLSSQVLYIGAVGAGGRVPGPIVFALAAALLVRSTDLACAQRPVLLVTPRRRDSPPREYGTALGWEGRMLFIGVTAAMGIATAGYLALTAYLVLLVGAKAVRSCIALADDDAA